MDFIEHTLTVKRSAHVYTAGNLEEPGGILWLVAHGYGQTGSRIISKFNQLNHNTHKIICPEALSLFYWGGVHGPHAASWMTSKNRLDEIEDFCNYLDQVYNDFIRSQKPSKIILLGFSQGATTLYRWVHSRKPLFDHFINWAGWMPEDIDMEVVSESFMDKHIIVFGEEDQYLTEDRIKMMNEYLAKAGMNPTFQKFKGKHEISRDALNETIKILKL